MGIGSGPILETLARMNHADRHIAEKILHDHEHRAAIESTLNPGCRELLDWLDEVGIAKALVTRNTRSSVRTVLARHGLNIQVCVTREDGKYKPDPAPLRLACDRLGLETIDAWMVGDGYHDIEAGNAAEMPTVWVSHGQPKTFSADPRCTVRDLLELTEMLRQLSDSWKNA
jgi:HAD superfamily hydrolase (TIGR01549 family)